MEKTHLYKGIVQHQGIRYALQELMARIYYFLMHTLSSEEVVAMFYVAVPQCMCGYRQIQTAEEYFDIMMNGNQREMLTCIYRFAMMLSKIMWHRLLPQLKDPNNAHILDTCQIDQVYLRRKIMAILYSYNVLDDNISVPEMIDELQSLFAAHVDSTVSGRSTYDQENLVRSFTRLHGTDPLVTFMGSRRKLSSEEQAATPKITFGVHTQTGEIVDTDLVEPLSAHELAVVGGFTRLSESKTAATNNLIKIYELPWVTGYMLHKVDEHSVLDRYAKRNHKLVRTGMSGTTQLMLECASIFGIDTRYIFLALIPWMDTARDHSLFEIVVTAQAYLPVSVYKVSNNDVEINELTELMFVQLVLGSLPPVPSSPVVLPNTQGFSVSGPIIANTRVPMFFFGGKPKKIKVGGREQESVLSSRINAALAPIKLASKQMNAREPMFKETGSPSTNACNIFYIGDGERKLMDSLRKIRLNISENDILAMMAYKFPNEVGVDYSSILPFSLKTLSGEETRTIPSKNVSMLRQIKGMYLAMTKQEEPLPSKRSDSPQWERLMEASKKNLKNTNGQLGGKRR